MAPRVEKRVDADAADGKKYTLSEFIEFYGAKKGQQKWDAADKLALAGKLCTVCGKGNHVKADCKHKDKECSTCGKVGHLAAVCRLAGATSSGKETTWKAKTGEGSSKVTGSRVRPPKVDAGLLEAAIAAATASPAKTLELIAPLDEGMPGPEHFKVTESPVGEVEEGGILIELLHISADPYMRSRIKSGAGGKAGPVSGFVSARVLVSKSEAWHPGDFMGASLPYTTVQCVSKEVLASTVSWKLTGLVDEDTASHGIGVLGMPGSTAYGGLYGVLRPKRAKKGEGNGETLFVSAASGAVGQLVGQLAKMAGCTVIGSAGGPSKCAALKEKFGYDHAIDYKTCADAEALKAKLKEISPDGIDMYFENVGGMHFDAAFACMRPEGRIAVCGAISQYNHGGSAGGGLGGSTNALPLGALIYPQIRIEGFVCMKWLKGQKGSFLKHMANKLKQGQLNVTETVTEGIENWGAAFQSLFTGANNGKVVVKVSTPLPLNTVKVDTVAGEKVGDTA